MPSSATRAVLLAVALLGCGEETPAPDPQVHAQADAPRDEQPAKLPVSAPAAAAAPVALSAGPRTLLLNGLLNSGFELLADGTASPPKYGAYWVGACAPAEGDTHSLVVIPGDAFRGQRCLRLSAGSEVSQKIVAAPRATGGVRVG